MGEACTRKVNGEDRIATGYQIEANQKIRQLKLREDPPPTVITNPVAPQPSRRPR